MGNALVFDQAVPLNTCAVLQGVGVWGTAMGKALVFDQALTKSVTNTYCAVLQGMGVWGTTMGERRYCLTRR
jgi:hypothetical protein